jgi:cytochrome c biogenesis protein CcmG, thiol:disulfide interchange protein DsbE
MLDTPENTTIQLSSLRGRWVFLNFWATWCVPCREEMPALQQLYSGKLNATSDQVTVLAVDRGESAGDVKKFLDEIKVQLPIAMDTQSKVSAQYDVVQLPLTYLIDPTGVVRYKHIGALDAATINEIVNKYISQQESATNP